MGKAKIVSEQGDGKYTIKIDYGTEERDARVEKLVARIAEIATEMEKANTKLQLAKAKMEASKAAVQQATSDYVAATQAVSAAFSAVSAAGAQLASVSSSPTATPAELASAKAMLASAEATYKAAQDDVKVKMDAQVEAAKALVDEKKKVAPLQIAVDLLKDEKAQLKKDKAYLSGLDLEETIPAWCADLTEDAEGEVATIEIPGENKSVLIKAGAESGGSVDGQLLARELQSPAQVFFNAAILPGWQKWQPTYRTGIITALDFEADTANVTLDDEASSAQKLDINQAKNLEAVPVIYMGCHAEAFEIGDACIVRFDEMDWAKPQVVGFVDNPKACPGGIGIQTETQMLILRPPVDGGRWKSREAKALNGGSAYAVNGGTSFVESGAGLCRSNKRITGPIFGHGGDTPQLRASTSFPISGLFISDGAVKQLMVSGDSLLFGGRSIKQLPDGPALSASYALPAVSGGDKWEMVSADQKGRKFAVCRTGTEDSLPPSQYVVAAAIFNEDENGGIELSAVQTFAHAVGSRAPDSEYKAPEWGEFHRRKTGDLLANHTLEYKEESKFNSESTYRAYVDYSGSVISDKVNLDYDSSIVKKLSRFHDGNWVEEIGSKARIERESTEVRINQSEEILFSHGKKIKTYSTDIEYDSLYALEGHYSRWVADVWTINASASFSLDNSINTKITKKINRIILSDSQFSVVASVMALLKYEYNESSGVPSTSSTGNDDYTYNILNTAANLRDWPEGYPRLPDLKSSVLSEVTVSLDVSASGNSSFNLDSSSFDRVKAKSNLESMSRWLDSPIEGRDYIKINDDGDGNIEGFVKQDIPTLLDSIIDKWVSDNLTDVKYAKDPKTGAGFLTFKWAGETHNYVVGDWGIAPASSKTDIGDNEQVSELMSI